MGLTWADSAPASAGFSILIGNADADLASIFAMPAGLIALDAHSAWLSENFGDPGTIQSSQRDAVSISAGDITGDIRLRIAFDDTNNALSGSYSPYGAGSFHRPFASLEATWTGQNQSWTLDASHYTVVPQPTTALLLATGLAALPARRRRRRLG
jgi:hypothetical protein